MTDNWLSLVEAAVKPRYYGIKRKIREATVVGADETGCHVNGDPVWFFTWQNPYSTFMTTSRHRDYATIERNFPQGFRWATLVSDSLPAQLKTPAARHQLCLAHLFRELKNLITGLDNSSICAELKTLFHTALEHKRQWQTTGTAPPTAELQAQLEQLLEVEVTGLHKKLRAFIRRLRKYRDSIFTFLRYAEVPADNNGSERAIRNVKVKTKVSGQFRSEEGAQRFAVLRSVLDTIRKRGQNAFAALSAILAGKPFRMATC